MYCTPTFPTRPSPGSTAELPRGPFRTDRPESKLLTVSYERFPDVLRTFLKLPPLTALNDALRAVMIDGDAVAWVGPEPAVMAASTVLTVAVSLKIFRWE